MMKLWQIRRCFRIIYNRWKYGFDTRDCWSLDHSFAEWIVPRLEWLRDHSHGVPSDVLPEIVGEWRNYTSEEVHAGVVKWNGILQEMIDGFRVKVDQNVDGSEWEAHKDAEMVERLAGRKTPFTVPPKYQRAKELFVKHLDDLWD